MYMYNYFVHVILCMHCFKINIISIDLETFIFIVFDFYSFSKFKHI